METSSNIGNTPSGQKSKFVAEEIRQQAGVSLEDKTGKPIGLYGNKLNHLEKKWRGRPEPEKNSPEYDEWNFWQDIKLILGNEDVGLSPLEVDLKRDGELTMGELSKLRQMMWNMVKSDDLAVTLLEKSKLQVIASLTLAKIEQVRNLIAQEKQEEDSFHSGITAYNQSLKEASEFLKNEVLLGEPAKLSIDQYQARLQKVINNPEKKGSRTSPQQRLSLLAAVSSGNKKNDIYRLANGIVEDTIRLALVNNLNQLKNGITKEFGVAWSKLRQDIAVLKRDQQGAQDFLKLVAPITKYIREHYRHDHAYLMSQALVHKQAVCAGKETMLGAILQEMLEIPNVKYTSVEVLGNNDFTSKHVTTEIEWGDFLVELDLNCNPVIDDQKNNNCLVNILKKTDTAQDYPGKRRISKSKNEQWVLRNGKYYLYQLVWGSSPHKVVIHEEFPSDYIDKNNLAILLSSERYLAILKIDRQKAAALLRAAGLYEEGIRLAPDGPSYKNNLASLLRSERYLAILENDGQKAAAVLRAVGLYEEGIRLAPDNPIYKNKGNSLFQPLTFNNWRSFLIFSW
jgi:hypothetical protein